jgi:hypothetical protein
MTLLTAEIRSLLSPLYGTEAVPLAANRIVCKFFDPSSVWTWYVVEWQEDEEDILFWSLVRDDCDEWGYFSLAELQTIRNCLGLPIERDCQFQPGPVALMIGTE